MPEEPTAEQLEAARLAGWNPEDGEPPVGWDGHTLPPPVDAELGHNGVPAPEPGDDDYPEPVTVEPTVEGPVLGEHADTPVDDSDIREGSEFDGPTPQ